MSFPMRDLALHSLLLATLVSLISCKTADNDVAIRPRLTPANFESILEVGKTTASQVWEIAGQALNRQNRTDVEVWTYEWVEQERRTAYSGTKIGAERGFMKNVPGYMHTLTRKTTLTLVFRKSDNVLVNYRFDRR